LIVQGNFLFREAVYDALRSLFPFLAVTKAKSVEETLAAIDTMCPDAIFLDIGLPDGNGFERTH
jgi:DNA-binding NarL/FixJ family response regulator